MLQVLLVLVVLTLMQKHPSTSAAEPDFWTFQVVAEYPHDAEAFTQGLAFDEYCDEVTKECKEVMYESTGLIGRSSVRRVELRTGKVLKLTPVSSKWFAEGLTAFGDELLQLTWQTPQGFAYNKKTLQQTKNFTTPLNDGWGLTSDGAQLIVSDGSSTLYWLDPTFKMIRNVIVKDKDREIKYLNEIMDRMCTVRVGVMLQSTGLLMAEHFEKLEWIRGEIWANIWQTQCIARIDPSTGSVKGWVFMHGLRQHLAGRKLAPGKPMDVLNGIAYDIQRNRYFVTGKWWPRIFEIVFKSMPYNSNAEAIENTRNTCIVGGYG